MDINQGNYSFLDQSMGVYEGPDFSNHTLLEKGIQSLLERNDLAEAEMTLDHLQEDVPVPSAGNERVELLRNEVQ